MAEIMLDTALKYANAGFKVFPCYAITAEGCTCGKPDCASPGKHPLTKRGFLEATTDSDTINKWWTKHTNASIGWRPAAGVIVLDADAKPGKPNGRETIKALTAKHGPLPVTPAARTGSDGRHLIFRSNAPIPNRSEILPGVDTRTHDGYIIVAPSIHVSGRYYQWYKGRSLFDIPIADMPVWLEAVLLEGAKATKDKTIVSNDDNHGKREPGRNVAEIQKHLDVIDPEQTSYDEWLAVGMAIKEAGGNVEMFDKWSKLDRGRYKPGEVAKKWKSFDRNFLDGKPRVGIGTLKSLAAAFSRAARSTSACLPVLVRASSVAYEEPKYTLKPYIQSGKSNMVVSDSGVGKTALAMAIAARVSTGDELFPGSYIVAEKGSVLIISVEDDLSVLRGRLEANGADLSKIHFLDNAGGVNFSSPIIEEKIKETGAGLLIVDPIQAFFGAGVDLHRANETRPILAKLAEMASRNNCAILLIAHFAKSGGAAHVNRSLGSVDIPAARRSVLNLGRNPADPSEIVMVQVKCSSARIGQSIAFTIGDKGGINFKGFSSLTADDLLKPAMTLNAVPFDLNPIVLTAKAIMENDPNGRRLTYEEFKSECVSTTGAAGFIDHHELKRQLDGGLYREIVDREKISVLHSQTFRANKRGILIQRVFKG